MRILTPHEIGLFRRRVYRHYIRHGRDLPWRRTGDPYHILVSEIMLQQTQVDRVIPKYTHFLRVFPTLTALAEAPAAQVLAAWQGLGYNRRALMLKQSAQEICRSYGGEVPRSPDILRTLPGIGPATAASIAAFAFNAPTVFIETNIRAVFIHHFFSSAARVSDRRLEPLVRQTLDIRTPARWYNALMDYGAMLKKKHGNPACRSAQYVRQSRFEGSDRQVRGRIVRMLVEKKRMKKRELRRALNIESGRIHRIISDLIREGFITDTGAAYRIAS